MGSLDIWIIIAALTFSTMATRSVFWLVGHRVTIPRRVQEMLRYAPACALAAIIGPDLLLGPDDHVYLALSNLKLLAGIAALGFYLLRRNMLQTILFGMLVFTLLRVSHVFAGAG